MPCFDDFDGVYFSTQSILLYHKDVLPYVKIVIVDNNPNSSDGKQTKDYAKEIGAKYISYDDRVGTSIAKQQVFENSDTPYVLCMDSHVMLETGSLTKLLMYYQCNENTNDLLQGPLLSENPSDKQVWTHLSPKWKEEMFGVWEQDHRGNDPDSQPFEIPMQGMGVFSCRRDAWVGFNNNFRGFGGEEWYIHQKFKAFGGRTLCLPFLRWSHRFRRTKIPYNVNIEDKIRNYLIGFLELGLDTNSVIKYFQRECSVSRETIQQLLFDAKCSQSS